MSQLTSHLEHRVVQRAAQWIDPMALTLVNALLTLTSLRTLTGTSLYETWDKLLAVVLPGTQRS
jgi:hypothetical protein